MADAADGSLRDSSTEVVVGTDAPGPASQCSPTSTQPAKRRRLDMYLVMDANITLPYTGLWEFAMAGLGRFFSDPRSAELGVGLRFYGFDCSPETYDLAPDVEVALVADNRNDLIGATAKRLNINASPAAAALEGGIRHQAKRAQQFPDSKQVVVLLTDGLAQDFTCPNGSDQYIEGVANNGFVRVPSIQTFVVGFGLPAATTQLAAEVLARFSPLDPIAANGGTGKAVRPMSNDNPASMNEALQEVRRKAEPCEYLVPAGVDHNLLSLVLTPGGELPRVDDPAHCDQLTGWYYDDNANPTSLVLCTASCQARQKDDSAAATIRLGCPPRRRLL